MKKIILLTIVAVMFVAFDGFGQCAMCRATVGSNLSEGRNTIGTGLNFGILYLLVIPYLIVGLGIFFYFRAAKQKLKEEGVTI